MQPHPSRLAATEGAGRGNAAYGPSGPVRLYSVGTPTGSIARPITGSCRLHRVSPRTHYLSSNNTERCAQDPNGLACGRHTGRPARLALLTGGGSDGTTLTPTGRQSVAMTAGLRGPRRFAEGGRVQSRRRRYASTQPAQAVTKTAVRTSSRLSHRGPSMACWTISSVSILTPTSPQAPKTRNGRSQD